MGVDSHECESRAAFAKPSARSACSSHARKALQQRHVPHAITLVRRVHLLSACNARQRVALQ